MIQVALKSFFKAFYFLSAIWKTMHLCGLDHPLKFLQVYLSEICDVLAIAMAIYSFVFGNLSYS